MKTIEQLIEEHNNAMEQAEREYIELRDSIIATLSKQFEERREHLSYRMQLFDVITKYKDRLKQLEENFNSLKNG